MAYITYNDYTDLGYGTVPETVFSRYEATARKLVDRHCFGRVTAGNATEDNKRGLCELVETYFTDDNPQLLNDKQIVTSFSNEGYSEVYAQPRSLTAVKSAEERALWIIGAFFTAEQRYKGV